VTYYLAPKAVLTPNFNMALEVKATWKFGVAIKNMNKSRPAYYVISEKKVLLPDGIPWTE
jgi:hypothetical protein